MASDNKTTPAIVLKIKEMIPTLSKSEQQVARYIIDHPEEVITLSVAALAEAAEVSDPTVVRACRSLGFTGYQDLKVTLTQSIVTPLQSVHEEIAPNDSMQTIITKIFNSTIHTLNYTHDTLVPADLQKAADMLASARRIYIFGLGASGPIASDLQHKLLRLGFDASVYVDAHLQAIATAYVGKDDIIVAISHSGSSRIVMSNLRHAHKNGAKIIGITSIGRSPLSKLADVCLFTASLETKYRILALSSRIAELTIIDSIYTYLALQSDNIQQLKVEHAMSEFKY